MIMERKVLMNSNKIIASLKTRWIIQFVIELISLGFSILIICYFKTFPILNNAEMLMRAQPSLAFALSLLGLASIHIYIQDTVNYMTSLDGIYDFTTNNWMSCMQAFKDYYSTSKQTLRVASVEIVHFLLINVYNIILIWTRVYVHFYYALLLMVLMVVNVFILKGYFHMINNDKKLIDKAKEKIYIIYSQDGSRRFK